LNSTDSSKHFLANLFKLWLVDINHKYQTSSIHARHEGEHETLLYILCNNELAA
jgi:hypothetical protein